MNLIKDLRTHQLRSREALASIRSERRLELCIERSRGRDDMTGTAMRFQEFCNDVDGDRGNCEAALGKLRHDVLYSLVGFFFTGAAALFGFLRLFSR